MSRLCPVRAQALKSPSATALVFQSRSDPGPSRWTYAELDRQVSAWVSRFRLRGVEAGDCIGVLSWNRPEVVAMFHAAGRIGAIWAPLNARLTAAEVSQQLALLAPRVIFAEEALADRLADVEIIEAAQRQAAGGDLVETAIDPSAVRAVLFTSGTTGQQKAAELTAANFDAAAGASASNLGGDPDQRWLACLPLFHVGGLAMVHRCAHYGATLVLHERFDAEMLWRDLRRLEITHTSLVATGLSALLEASPDEAPSQMRGVLVGGGPVPALLLSRARARGFAVLQTYGLTEACSQVTTERPNDADGITAGPPLDGIDVRIVDSAGAVLDFGMAGEIEVRGPTVMRGYRGDPEATSNVLHDGWLRTGDVGEIDERGRLIVHARRTDLIVSGGENVYPAEVEAVLAVHPAVAEAAVVGIGDERWGEVPIALVVTRGESGDGVLDRWCRERLAGFKTPRRFVKVRALPKTASGKVDRARARTLAEKSR